MQDRPVTTKCYHQIYFFRFRSWGWIMFGGQLRGEACTAHQVTKH